MIKNILSIDVEEVFQAEYVKSTGQGQTEFRTPNNLPAILKLLKEFDTEATFFIVGNIVEQFPHLLNDIAFEGHEIGFHSYDHVPLWRKTCSQLEQEIANFDSMLDSVGCGKCRGFRAPTFSLDASTSWAVNALVSSGICYDSSIFPAWTPLYGVRKAPIHPYKLSKNDLTKNDGTCRLWEFPVAVYKILDVKIPGAGGFYLRTAPSIVKRAIRSLNRKGLPAVVYVDSWELDPQTPRRRLGLYKSLVTYHNLSKTKSFLRNLLDEFQFTSFTSYMKEAGIN